MVMPQNTISYVFEAGHYPLSMKNDTPFVTPSLKDEVDEEHTSADNCVDICQSRRAGKG